MTPPHGAAALRPLYVADEEERAALRRESERLPSLAVNSSAATYAVMLGAGYFTPLTGYMGRAETLHVAEKMTRPDGLLWPVPITNLAPRDRLTPEVRGARRIALRDPNVAANPPLAVMDIEAIEPLSSDDRTFIAQNVFRTADPAHPGVADLMAAGDHLVSGPLRVLNYSYFGSEFPDTFRTAGQIRDEFTRRGWQRVVAFQTRNPMHRAHEELCRMAQQAVRADGILIHMLLGRLKPGDIPAAVRDAAIRKMVELYFPPNTVLVAGYGFDMLYAGPREAVLHAIFRQNCGCTHLIVGRDHAGVGSYYGPFDAQTIFDEIPAGGLKIEIFRADHTAWSRKLGRVVMMRDCSDHAPDDYITLSGTKVRDMLTAGQPLPPEFARPEVAAVLMDYYRSESAH